MTVAVRRRSSSRDEEPEEREERPSRRRSRDDDDSREERGSRRGRSRDRDEPAEEERPRRGRRNRDDDDEKPSRGRRGSRGSDEGGRGSRRGTSGFGAYSEKKRSGGGDFAEDFKPGDNKAVLIKFLEDGPFDSYHQHWIDDMPKGERKSYVCLDDDYFGEEGKRDECPLCEIGEKSKTYALFNVVDLSNPRKPEVKVWSAPPAVADMLERASEEKKSSPINRDDLYFEVERTKKGQKYQWIITPVKERDLGEDFDMDPLEPDEIEEFENDMFEDRSAVTKVDDFKTLDKLADDLVN